MKEKREKYIEVTLNCVFLDSPFLSFFVHLSLSPLTFELPREGGGD